MITIFHVGQRVKIRNKDLYGVITSIDKDLPYVYNVRLDNKQYNTFTNTELEEIPLENPHQSTGRKDPDD